MMCMKEYRKGAVWNLRPTYMFSMARIRIFVTQVIVEHKIVSKRNSLTTRLEYDVNLQDFINDDLSVICRPSKIHEK